MMEYKINELESKISSLALALDSLSSRLTVLESTSNLKANSSYVNRKISELESDITLLQSELALKIDKNKIINTIKQATGEIKGSDVDGKVCSYSEVSNGESKSSIAVYENGEIECKVENSKPNVDTLEIGRLEDLPDEVLKQFKLGKYAE